MSNKEQQMVLRTASAAEHAEIKKQLLGVAKKTAIIMGCVFIFLLTAAIVSFAQEQAVQKAEPKKLLEYIRATILGLSLPFGILIYYVYVFTLPYYKLCKRKYYIADCIVSHVCSPSNGKGGNNYYATVTYANEADIVPVEDTVPVLTEEIYQKIIPGKHAVVVFIPEETAYSLCVL